MEVVYTDENATKNLREESLKILPTKSVEHYRN
jgi:hypothetical protein